MPETNISTNNEITIIEGNNITTTCEAIGYPEPTVVWSRNNGALSDRVLISESVSTLTGNGNVTRVSVNLTITNVYREDTGVYTCSASNYIGSDDKNVSITVQCKSIILHARYIVYHTHYSLIDYLGFPN